MCIAYLAISAHPRWPLFIAANRDEFHARPCLAAAPWPDRPDIISGIDTLAGGTWLGVTKQGRYALITNYRDLSTVIPDAPSRGALVSNYLAGAQAPQEYAGHVQAQGHAYNGFNLIVGDHRQAWYVGNRSGQDSPTQLAPGRYVLSNHLLDTPWPKSQRLRRALDTLSFDGLNQSLTPVFRALRDTTVAEDQALPATGLALERERLLSSPFIVSDTYGTRCSTVIALQAEGPSLLSETSYNAQGHQTERHDWPFPGPAL
ncbi:NRDE family protein [Allopusillimonas ginsengisoli]|uniref:NRDE family protein n=1 Tax=Allopusillimonas ginsengisoli TaxID=453575 RepID=UPI0010205FB5|nr:NRDE family protein [Allopusillimonas ginsengisoli]TEA71866.1 NRDE family protein [Allopusillimonas ginsengisoli]